MIDKIIDELLKLELKDERIYRVSKNDMRNFCIKLLEVIDDSNMEQQPLKSGERDRLLNANINIMNKYKETFDDLKVLVDYLNGDEKLKDGFYNVLKRYENKTAFSDSLKKEDEDVSPSSGHIRLIG